MPAQAQQRKADLVEQVVRGLGGDAGPLARFVRRVYEGVAPDLLLEFTPDAAQGAAASLWSFAATRAKGTPKIRVFNPTTAEHGWTTTHTVVEIVNDDMPFLVDSVVACLNRQDLIIHLLIHPVVRVRRDAAGKLQDVLAPGAEGGANESIIHVEVGQRLAPQALADIHAALEGALAEVRAAVADWRAMHAKAEELIAEVDGAPVSAEEKAESRAFLEWIRDDNFTFLGARDYKLESRDGRDFLDIVPNSGLGVLRAVSAESAARHKASLPPDMAAVARRNAVLIITKANTRSRVHRPVYMDYIGVRRFDPAGNVTGERRFVGLFTSSAYYRDLREIPLLRHKVRQVVERSGFNPGGHSGKAILNILETYPRDELFRIGADELFDTAMGILHLEERQRVRLFVRRDSYARFYSCLVYVPRERYTTSLRQRIEAVLRQAFRADNVDFTTMVGDSPMARIHFILRGGRHDAGESDIAAIEARVAAATRLWSDDLQDALIARLGEARGHELFAAYRDAFPASYQEQFPASEAVEDVERVEAVLAGAPIAMDLYRPADGREGELRFQIFHDAQPVSLSHILPMLEHMGLRVLSEIPFAVKLMGRTVYMHDFGLELPHKGVDLAAVREKFHIAFGRVWSGEMGSDPLNGLVIGAGLDWRQIVVLRAYTRYLRQTASPFSLSYVEQTLARNPAIAGAIARLFEARFDPDAPGDAKTRSKALDGELVQALDAVTSLDEDRILRHMRNLVQSTLRTNHFQTRPDGGPKPYLSIKLDSRKVDDLPLPRPLYEIFVYSPRVEGVHLRGGKVARGGIRWSDRPEDFRTEVLSLMKAQMVKNAVIVPVGSKGGFVVKRPPKAREALQAEVVECYRTLIRGLLDITDNRKGADIVPPPRVVRHDGDDPYLVVAADKGTATFSDIANGVAREYGFWLDDAFASGGSAGYDHKGMGITARGGWVSVERHFRELGHDIRKETFSAIGVGDMAGDVFGNGMLQSERMSLLGAFNHMHIFLDPDPDPARSFAERTRLFALPRSTWADYDAALISKGGGVFARDLKCIKLSPEAKAMLGLAEDGATPAEIIRALLRMKADLLWFGGIGTFVKAEDERNAEAGDRANDALRVNGRELAARVVGEGANLGVTQRGRIEYALRGGKINTDAIDNSGGVDCSDHEVNIKILLGEVVQSGAMDLKRRDALLQRMTDEVAELVLKDNYQQTQAITAMEARAGDLLEQQSRMMRAMERAGRLDRGLENLPNDETLGDRRAAGQGLVRPELAVLLAYGKIALYDELLASELPDDPLLVTDLERYFPKPLQEGFKDALHGHRLRREIISNVVTNSMVNRVGASFVHNIAEKTGHQAADIARAYAIARDAFDLRTLWRAVEALDWTVPAGLQTEMMLGAGRLVERSVFWFLRHGKHPLDVAALAAEFRPGIAALSLGLDGLVTDERAARFGAHADRLMQQSVPAELARRVASSEDLAAAPDVVRLARGRNVAVERVGALYFALGARLGFDWLRAAASSVKTETAWQRAAVDSIVDDLFSQQTELTARVLETANGAAPPKALEDWLGGRKAAVARTDSLLAEYRAGSAVDLAMLAVANRQLRALN